MFLTKICLEMEFLETCFITFETNEIFVWVIVKVVKNGKYSGEIYKFVKNREKSRKINNN